jgi:ketosteroid isomerase-like protein
MAIMPQISHPRSPAGGDITETVTQMEEQWISAAKANDATKVALLLSEVFVEMDSNGSLHNKSQTLDRIKSAKWQVNEISDIKVTVHGGMAIATGTWRGKGTLADGKAVDAHERWLDTWLKNGKWQCIASASAPISG